MRDVDDSAGGAERLETVIPVMKTVDAPGADRAVTIVSVEVWTDHVEVETIAYATDEESAAHSAWMDDALRHVNRALVRGGCEQ